ncbi:NADPH-dependent FMN reductase [Oceanobacter mangrovi]|uniref:NADPH-dependent FMN reductase n=1 Tax=Oceanobacter mangrovi TaxID=2862510 RepID=UPI001C8D0703|nr:NADPH-dependent FMN reductase [Oceanobacter mangrovi]
MQIHDVADLKNAIVAASIRHNGESQRIAEQIRDRFLLGNADVFDLFPLDLPIWHMDAEPDERVDLVLQRLAAADALIFVIPEWQGMVPTCLKNLLLWSSSDELAHKPVLPVALSLSSGGAFAIAEMRATGYRNGRLLYLPEHLILRSVSDLWNDQDHPADAYLAGRSQYCIDQLLIYASVLKPVRNSLCIGLNDFPDAMI